MRFVPGGALHSCHKSLRSAFFSFIYSLFHSIRPLTEIVDLVMKFSYEYTPTTKTLLFLVGTDCVMYVFTELHMSCRTLSH